MALEIFKEVQGDDFSVERFDAGILSEVGGKAKIVKKSGNELV